MATKVGQWVKFSGDYACKQSDINHVYGVNGMTRIVLENGTSFHVPELYADVIVVLTGGES